MCVGNNSIFKFCEFGLEFLIKIYSCVMFRIVDKICFNFLVILIKDLLLLYN